MSKPDVMEAMEDSDNQWRLFPHGQMVYARDPYRLLRSNLERVYNDSCLWVTTKDITSMTSSQCQSLSVGRTFLFRRGTRYDIDYYGSDVDDLHNHLIVHLNHSRARSVHDGIYMYLLVHPNIDKTMVSQIIDKIPGFEFAGSNLKMYMFEKPKEKASKL